MLTKLPQMAALIPIKLDNDDYNIGLVIKSFELDYYPGPNLDKVTGIYFNFKSDDQSTMQCMNYALYSSRVQSKRVNVYISESFIDLVKQYLPKMYNYVFKIDYRQTVPHVIVTNFVNQTFDRRPDLNVQLQVRAINLQFTSKTERSFNLVPDEHSFPPPSYEASNKEVSANARKLLFRNVSTGPNSWTINVITE